MINLVANLFSQVYISKNVIILQHTGQMNRMVYKLQFAYFC